MENKNLTRPKFVLRARPAAMAYMALILSPGWLLGGWNIFAYSHIEVGCILIGISFSFWGYLIGFLRVVVTDDSVQLWRFWKEWELPLQGLTVHTGTGGDIAVFPAIILKSAITHERRDIVVRPFLSEQVGKLIQSLKDAGAR